MLKKYIWKVDRECDCETYLFVFPDVNIISIVFPQTYGSRLKVSGYGLWYYEVSANEIATCIISPSREVRWLHELYRDYDTWLHWYTRGKDIEHHRVDISEVPKEFVEAHQKQMDRYSDITIPKYDEAKIHS